MSAPPLPFPSPKLLGAAEVGEDTCWTTSRAMISDPITTCRPLSDTKLSFFPAHVVRRRCAERNRISHARETHQVSHLSRSRRASIRRHCWDVGSWRNQGAHPGGGWNTKQICSVCWLWILQLHTLCITSSSAIAETSRCRVG